MSKKPLDAACDAVTKLLIEKDKTKDMAKPFLDKKTSEIEDLDEKIAWFEDKISDIEAKKFKLLDEIQDLFDTAGVTKHSLKNGYTIKPDHRRKVNIKDIAGFLKWLKTNMEPQEILDFFKNSLKVTSIKRFCEMQYIEQREKGNINPSIDGIDFGELTFSKLTTCKKEVKKCKRKK